VESGNAATEEAATPAGIPEPTVDPFEEQLAADGEAVPAGTRLPEGDPFSGASFGLKPNVDVRVIIGAATPLGPDDEPGFRAEVGLTGRKLRLNR
jgi:hypothetical protein